MKQQLVAVVLTALAWANPALAARDVGVVCQTTKGPINIVIRPDWSPKGAERFLQLVDAGHFNRVPLFRCLDGFLCQFGFPQAKSAAKPWPAIADDPKQPALRNFKRGYISFAGAGPNTRTEHLFITLGDKVESLGSQPWETPVAYVTPAERQPLQYGLRRYSALGQGAGSAATASGGFGCLFEEELSGTGLH